MKRLLCISALALSLGSCATKSPVREFPKVQVPSMMEDANERVQYATLHFFDAFRDDGATVWRTDSSHYSGVKKDDFEREFASWLVLMDRTDRMHASACLTRAYGRCGDAYDGFVRCCEKYLYDPNSPYRDEDLYGTVLWLRLSDQRTPDNMRQGLEADLKLCRMNPVGGPAADFRFADRTGAVHRMYEVEAPYLIVLFSNPGCQACKTITEDFESNARLCAMRRMEALKILNVYPDSDLEAWREYLPNYPSDYICGYDPDGILRADSLYSLRAIPSLYLLDRDKTVLFKDCTTERILNWADTLQFVNF